MKGTLAQLAKKLHRLSMRADADRSKALSLRREESYSPLREGQGNGGAREMETLKHSQTLFRICGLL